jgi:hypothetical protein
MLVPVTSSVISSFVASIRESLLRLSLHSTDIATINEPFQNTQLINTDLMCIWENLDQLLVWNFADLEPSTLVVRDLGIPDLRGVIFIVNAPEPVLCPSIFRTE